MTSSRSRLAAGKEPGLHKATVSIAFPPRFDFWRTVYSHGWCSLLPFNVDKEQETFSLVFRLKDGTVADCIVRADGKAARVQATTPLRLSKEHEEEIGACLRTCLRLEEDFEPFYREANRHARFRWIAKSGAGRLLRAPTVFEDLIKMMCTTNCSWSLTTAMVQNLVETLGEQLPTGARAFPTPQALAGVSEGFVRKKIKAGYRSPYLVACARRIASGELDVESWRTSALSTEDLFQIILKVKGMGPYAAGNLLRLLGRYNHLALDSWVRSQYARLHHGGRKVADRTIERAYKPYGRWRGLFFWLEMTRYWFDKKFPDW